MLKQQIHRLKVPYLHDYRLSFLIGGMHAYHYMDRLDIAICRLLREKGYEKNDRSSLSYLLVTYAIEKRAEDVYSSYDHVLKQAQSPVRITSILLEERSASQKSQKSCRFGLRHLLFAHNL